MSTPFTDLSAVRRPIQQARGLPNAHYIDDAVIRRRKPGRSGQTVGGAGRGGGCARTGRCRADDVSGHAAAAGARDKSGAIRVFQNICRHRGMILVEEPRKIEGAIRCPYHSWCYSTEGKLVSTPHVGGPGHNTHDDIDRSLLGLIEIRSHVWRDVVWINLSRQCARVRRRPCRSDPTLGGI